MGDHLSPVIEGFTGTMGTLFTEMLSVTPTTHTNLRGPAVGVTPTPKLPAAKVAFLKDVITQQKKAADSLMASAKKIGPVAQKISAADSAYKSAFQSDITAALPNFSGSLQGFTIFFFLLSYISLAVIVAIHINQISGNLPYSLQILGMFAFGLILIGGIVTRLG